MRVLCVLGNSLDPMHNVRMPSQNVLENYCNQISLSSTLKDDRNKTNKCIGTQNSQLVFDKVRCSVSELPLRPVC